MRSTTAAAIAPSGLLQLFLVDGGSSSVIAADCFSYFCVLFPFGADYTPASPSSATAGSPSLSTAIFLLPRSRCLRLPHERTHDYVSLPALPAAVERLSTTTTVASVASPWCFSFLSCSS